MVDLPSKNGDFHGFSILLLVYQRVRQASDEWVTVGATFRMSGTPLLCLLAASRFNLA